MSSFRSGKCELGCETPSAPVGRLRCSLRYRPRKNDLSLPSPHQSFCALAHTSPLRVSGGPPHHPRPLRVPVQLSRRSSCRLEQSSLASAASLGHCLPGTPASCVPQPGVGWPTSRRSGVSSCKVGLAVRASALAPAQRLPLQVPGSDS